MTAVINLPITVLSFGMLIRRMKTDDERGVLRG